MSCARCYDYRGVVVVCPDCTMERLASTHAQDDRLLAAFERHMRRLLDHEQDERFAEMYRGQNSKLRRQSGLVVDRPPVIDVESD